METTILWRRSRGRGRAKYRDEGLGTYLIFVPTLFKRLNFTFLTGLWTSTVWGSDRPLAFVRGDQIGDQEEPFSLSPVQIDRGPSR